MSKTPSNHKNGSDSVKRSPTVTRPILLRDGSDRKFRKFLYDVFTVSERINRVRRYLGSRIGLSGPQFMIMTAAGDLEQSKGVSVGELASYLHVTGTMITAESRNLLAMGYLLKTADTADRRVSRLRLSRKGRLALESIAPERQQINDLVFDLDSQEDFETLCRQFDRMVETSQRAVTLMSAAEQHESLRVHAGGLAVQDRSTAAMLE